MDKNTIIQGVIGLLLAGLGSAIGWLFNSITELKHNVDIINVQVQQNSGELNDIWGKYNEAQKGELMKQKTFYDFQIEYYKNLNNATK
jgi:hypothetical protein